MLPFLFSLPLITWMAFLCTYSSMNSGLLNTDKLNDALKPQQHFTQCLVCFYLLFLEICGFQHKRLYLVY